MEYGEDTDRAVVIAAITGKIGPLSQHKFARYNVMRQQNVQLTLFCKSSNVVEKCITFGSESDKKAIVAEISQER